MVGIVAGVLGDIYFRDISPGTIFRMPQILVNSRQWMSLHQMSARGQLPPAAICPSTTFDRQLFGCHKTAIACSLYVNLLRHFQRVVDFDPQVAHRAIEFRVAEQQLDRTEVFGPTID